MDNQNQDNQPQQQQQPQELTPAELKHQIAAEIRPLLSQVKDPQERFYTIMSLLREKWDGALASQAFDTARSIQDPEEKIRSLQSLMNEADYQDRDNQSYEG
jgi:uncharacterized membrane protein YccC